MDDVKQVIVVRKDLKMRTGKAIAQGAHASTGGLLAHLDITDDGKSVSINAKISKGSPMYEWIIGRFKKITLYVNSEQELHDIANSAQEAGLHVTRIKDAGLTEFNGVTTFTCISIGPDFSSKIDKITGNLPLL